jgi:WD40 repeat protein
VTASNDRTIGLWDARTLAPIRSFPHATAVRVAAIDAAARLVAGGTADGTVQIWDIATGLALGRLHHADTVMTVQFTSRGLFTTSIDHRAIFWDVGVEVPDVARVTAFVRCHVPFRLIDMLLVPAVPEACE